MPFLTASSSFGWILSHIFLNSAACFFVVSSISAWVRCCQPAVPPAPAMVDSTADVRIVVSTEVKLR